MFCHIIKNSGIHRRNQLQQSHLTVQVVIKDCRAGNMILVVQIENNVVIMNHCHIGKINAGKCIVAFGSFLFGAGSGNNLAVKDKIYTVGAAAGGKAQAVQQICFCICNFQINRFLGAGNYNRLG